MIFTLGTARLHPVICIPIAAALTLAGCAVAASARAQRHVLGFTCDAGISFSVAADAKRAWVTTAAGSYVLKRRRSSIGRKYESATVAFIQDDDRAVLVGADGGPFRNCRLR